MKFSIFRILAVTMFLILAIPSMLNTNIYTTALSGTVFFEDGFEGNVPSEMSFNGSLPLGSPTTPVGWTTNDIDSSLLANGTIWGPGRVWMVQNASEAHHGQFYARYLAGPMGVFGDWEKTRYALLMWRHWDDPQTPHEFSSFYVRWYQKFFNLPSSREYAVIPFYMLGLKYDGSRIISYYMTSAEVSVLYYDGGLNILFSKLWSDGTQTSAKVPVDLATNQWYCFEVWYKSGLTDGEYKLWLDGNELISLTGLNSIPPEGITRPNGFDLGLCHRDDENSSYTAAIDCVVAADYRVGLEDASLPSTVPVSIQIVDDQNGNPILNALVKLGSYQEYTNQSGFATFTEIPRSSNYELNVTKSGYHSQKELLHVSQTAIDLKINLESSPFSTPQLPKYESPLTLMTPLIVGTLVLAGFIGLSKLYKYLRKSNSHK